MKLDWTKRFLVVIVAKVRATLAASDAAAPSDEHWPRYAAYANHCAIQKQVPMTFHSWMRIEPQPRFPAEQPPAAVAESEKQ